MAETLFLCVSNLNQASNTNISFGKCTVFFKVMSSWLSKSLRSFDSPARSFDGNSHASSRLISHDLLYKLSLCVKTFSSVFHSVCVCGGRKNRYCIGSSYIQLLFNFPSSFISLKTRKCPRHFLPKAVTFTRSLTSYVRLKNSMYLYSLYRGDFLFCFTPLNTSELVLFSVQIVLVIFSVLFLTCFSTFSSYFYKTMHP